MWISPEDSYFHTQCNNSIRSYSQRMTTSGSHHPSRSTMTWGPLLKCSLERFSHYYKLLLASSSELHLNIVSCRILQPSFSLFHFALFQIHKQNPHFRKICNSQKERWFPPINDNYYLWMVGMTYRKSFIITIFKIACYLRVR